MSDGQFDILNIGLSEVEAPGADHWCLIRDTENAYALTVVYGDPKVSYVIPAGAPVELTAPILNADTHNWSPTGLLAATVVLISASVPVNLTGIVAAGLDPHAKRKLLINVGAQPITLKNQDVNSSAANRFLLLGGSGDILLQSGDAQELYYVDSDQRWRSA